MVRWATPCTRGYGFNTQAQQSFFSTRKKALIYLLKLWKLSCCLLVINKNNSRSLKVTHLSLRMTFAELPIGKFSSYTLVSLWSGISSTVRKERLMIITANSEQKKPTKWRTYSNLTFLVIYLNCVGSSSSFSFSTSSQGR